MSDKLVKADKHVIEAEKYLKTGFLKWRPDYDNAANEYTHAATCYGSVQMFDKCVDAFLKAADCQMKNHSFFSAAKSYEQVAMMSKKLNDWNSVAKYLDIAGNLFREHGTPDTAALTLNRGAQMIEAQNPEKAAEWYCKSSEVTMLEDRPRNAAEYANKAVRIFLKLKRYDDAVEWIKKALNYLIEAEDNQACGRLVVCLVLVQLTRDDFVAAQKSYDEGKCYLEQQEIYTLTQLLDGFDQMDANLINQSLNSPFIKSLDNEFTKLARNFQQKYSAKITIDNDLSNESQKEVLNEESGSML